jgi:hypothetical protein
MEKEEEKKKTYVPPATEVIAFDPGCILAGSIGPGGWSVDRGGNNTGASSGGWSVDDGSSSTGTSAGGWSTDDGSTGVSTGGWSKD